MSPLNKTILYINGMHCQSCDILVTSKFKEFPNIKSVKADVKQQEVEIEYTGSVDIEALQRKIESYGYDISVVDGFPTSSHLVGLRGASKPSPKINNESLSKKVIDASAIASILFILYYFAQDLHILPSFQTDAGTGLTYASVFVLGLVASTSTCMATSGALYLATIGKSRNMLSGIAFNLGRLLSYGLYGLAAGYIGKSLIQGGITSTVLSVVVAAGMLLIGLDMLQIISLSDILPSSWRKSIFLKLEEKLKVNPQKTAFMLGAITYLLPCGFTQSVQLYALSTGDPIKSALLMIIFALGTMPALLAISLFSSVTKSYYYGWFLRVIGVIVVLVGLNSFTTILKRYDIRLPLVSSGMNVEEADISHIIVRDGVQIATMSVNASGYYPNSFVVKKDQPVRWVIKGENVFGCQGNLIVPKLGIERTLALGENVIEFTPHETGKLGFSCVMGMYEGYIDVI